MNFRKLIIGTRGSKLALWQAEHVQQQLKNIGVEAELKIIKTQGDIIQHLRLDKLEGKGFFTKELEESLLNGDIDLAVHSHKDLPTQNPPGLIIAATSEREDPSEYLIILKDSVDKTQRFSVKADAIIGTSSNRRKAQLQALRPDFKFADLRGNVITRLDKLRTGNYDAIVLAKAGMTRIEMDLSEFNVQELHPTEVVPAPAQGVLAIQIRETDHELKELLQKIHDSETADTIAVERKILSLFEAGCHAPLGSYCRKNKDVYEVWTSQALTADEFPDRVYLQSPSIEGLAEKVFEKFSNKNRLPKSVFISRDIEAQSYFARSLAKHSIQLQAKSLIDIKGVPADLSSIDFNQIDWVCFTSKNSIEKFFELNPACSEKTQFAVIGRGTESVLRQFGISPDFSGENLGIDMRAIATQFSEIARGKQVLIPQAKHSLGSFQNELAKTAQVHNVVVYESHASQNIDSIDTEILIFTSPSNVYAYFDKHSIKNGQKVIAIGHASANALKKYGIEAYLPSTPDEIGLAEAVFSI